MQCHLSRVEQIMKPYVLALAVGLLVGVIYGLLHVRSPAPPVVALVGLLGILLGEQVVPLARRLLSDQPVTAAWASQQCGQHVLGQLPGGKDQPHGSGKCRTEN
jgi:XapX domain-containing protein